MCYAMSFRSRIAVYYVAFAPRGGQYNAVASLASANFTRLCGALTGSSISLGSLGSLDSTRRLGSERALQ